MNLFVYFWNRTALTIEPPNKEEEGRTMTPWRTALLTGLALIVFAAATPAYAGWQSTFQATCFRKGCFGCGSAPAVAAYTPVAADCCAPNCASGCAQPSCCEMRYVARSFYQPVTTYQCRSFYEPVTTYRTSFFWEPQTCLRHSTYFDPCTCSYQVVATPVTSYRLRAQSCPVTSFVQRTAMVPVTSYRIATYYEPQTCCPTPAVSASPGCCGSAPAVSAGPAAPAVSENPGSAGVQEQRQPANGGSSPLYDQKNSSPLPNAPNGNGNQTGFRPLTPKVPPSPAPRQPTVAPRLDKIAEANTAPKARLATRITIVDD
jgi:hypothetical protein